MANELSILNAMKQVIQSGLNSYLPQSIEQIGDKNVVIDFPDTDQMPMKNMFYGSIYTTSSPERTSLETNTRSSQEEPLSLSLPAYTGLRTASPISRFLQ